MFKVSFFFYKRPYLSYFILIGIFCVEGYIKNYILPISDKMYVIIMIISFFIYYGYLVSDCLTRPQIDFMKDCDINLYKERLNMISNVKNVVLYKKNYNFHILLCTYYEFGPSKELIQTYEEARNNKPYAYQKQWYSKLLFYMYIEIEDYDNAQKILEELKNLAKFKNDKIKNFFQYLESILKYVQENDDDSKEVILNHIKTSKRRPDITYDYYILAKNCLKNEDTKNEKEYLKKVVEFGNNTLMAKKAKERLAIIKG